MEQRLGEIRSSLEEQMALLIKRLSEEKDPQNVLLLSKALVELSSITYPQFLNSRRCNCRYL